MSEIKIINNLIPNSINNSDNLNARIDKDSGISFNDILQDTVTKLSQVQNEAEKAVKEIASGGDITEAIIAMEKADMSFQFMIEVRNKLIAAYEEVQRMQV